MTIVSVRTPALTRPTAKAAANGVAGGAGRRVLRWLAVGGGVMLMAVGAVGALLPGHLGVPVLVVGLVLVLRSSHQARRRFIGLQRRHPKIVFPIRRLLRREPEFVPVAWQQMLRFEKAVLPRRWRAAAGLRRRFFRKKR
jgi:hypothetical protein